MGWCSGDALCAFLWEDIRKYIPKKKRVEALMKIIEKFEGMDMDCYEEIAETPEGEEALKKLHPNWDWWWDEEPPK